MASSATLKVTAACLLLLCIVSDVAQPSLASLPSPDDGNEATAGRALLQQLAKHDIAEELGLAEQRGDLLDICSQACQTCLIVCAVTCVLNKVPIACFANCTVNNSCFGKQVETCMGR